MEADSFRAKLASLGLQGDFFGACTYGWLPKQFVIRRYLDYPINGCIYREQGYFQDPLGIFCPQCKEGQVVIVRPARNKQTYTLIGCSCYPDCSFKTKYLPLKIPCRFCGVPLILSAGEQLTCYCPQCKRRALVPLTVASWPHLFEVGDTCPHGHPGGKCEVCNLSRAEKRNVIDLELPGVAHSWLQRRLERERTQEEVHRTELESAGWTVELEGERWVSERDQELEEIRDWWFSFWEGFWRAAEEGWFYPD